MKRLLTAVFFAALVAGCSRNEPGTMGNGNSPASVATGAPADAAKGAAFSDPKTSSSASEHASSSFDDSSTNTNRVTAPEASTKNGVTDTAAEKR